MNDSSSETPNLFGEKPSQETIGPFTVKYYSDGSVRISDSKLARFGCAPFFALTVLFLIGTALRTFLAGSPMGIVFLVFAAPLLLATLILFYNRREIEASRRLLKGRWWRVGGFEAPSWFMHGEYVIRDGVLGIEEEVRRYQGKRYKGRSFGKSQIVKVWEKGDRADPGHVVLQLNGPDVLPLALRLVEILSRATGFSIINLKN